MNNDTVMVLTQNSLKSILQQGGTGDWKAREESVRRCRWVVTVRHRQSRWHNETEEHGAAFLIGRIVGVRPTRQNSSRLLILFDQYATLNVRGAWPSSNRNPVAYTSLSRLKIDPQRLDWASLGRSAAEEPIGHRETSGNVIEQARRMIADSLAVAPDAVKISIQL